MSALLRLDGVSAWYGRAQVLFEVGLEARAGEVVALMGRNGAGKSTLMKSAMGLIDRIEGGIAFDGAGIAGLAPHDIARRGLGYVPEERRVFPGLTVMENLAVGARAGGEGGWTAERLFELFPNLGRMRERRGGAMSGGEQQMLAIARTLMGNPRLILLDEPSEGLAPVIVDGLADAVAELKRQGLSILLSEQNLHFAETVSDRAYVIEKGRMRWEGSMADLASDEPARRAWLSV